MGLDLPGISEDEWTEFVRGRFADQAQARTSGLSSLGFRAQTNDRIGGLSSLSSLSAPSVPMPTLPRMPQIPTPQLPSFPQPELPQFPRPQIPGFPGQAQPTPSPAPMPGPSPAPAPRLGFPTIRPRPPSRPDSFLENSQAQIDSLAAAPVAPTRPGVTDFRRRTGGGIRPVDTGPLPITPGQQLPGALPTTPSLPRSEEPATATDAVDSKWKTSFDHKATYTGSYRTGTPHRGIDLVPHKGGIGTPIEAFHPGTVSLIQRDSGGAGGLMVYVKDDQGLTHAYMHLQGTAPDLKVGQRVNRGDVIAAMGESGTEGSPHLHYEVRKGLSGDPLDQLIDPRPYMKGAGLQPGRAVAPARAVPSAAPSTLERADTSSRESFVSSLLPVARQYEQRTGIPAEALIATAAHESNWGKAGGNMLFGIKGPGMSTPTWEVVNGQRVNITDSFRTYPSVNAAFDDFVGLVSQGRYKGAWDKLQETGDWREFFRGINRAGYATDPIWGDKIVKFTEGQISPLAANAPAAPPIARSTGIQSQPQSLTPEPLPPEVAEPFLPQTTAPPRPPMFAPRQQTAQPQLGPQSSLSGAPANPIEQIGSTIANAITDGLTAIFGGAPGGPPGGTPPGGPPETEEDRRRRLERRQAEDTVFPTLPEYMRLPQPGEGIRNPLERFQELAKKPIAEGIAGAAAEAADEAMQRQYAGLGPSGLSLLDPRLSDPGADVSVTDIVRALDRLGPVGKVADVVSALGDVVKRGGRPVAEGAEEALETLPSAAGRLPGNVPAPPATGARDVAQEMTAGRLPGNVPRTLYHGTAADYAAVAPGQRTFEGENSLGPGHYLTTEPAEAARYAERAQDFNPEELPGFVGQGANVRKIDMPADMRLFDLTATGRDMEPAEIRRIAVTLEREGGAHAGEAANELRYLASVADPGAKVSGDASPNVVFDAMRSRGVEPRAISSLLRRLGYEGIEHIDLSDGAHNVLIFPEATSRLRNAISGRQGGQASPVFAARAGASATGGALGYATTPEGASPEERIARTAAGAGLGLGLGAAATRGMGRSPALQAFDLAKLPAGASPEVRAAAVDAGKILKSRADATATSSTPLTPDDVKRVLNGTVQLKEETTDRRAKIKAIEDYIEQKNGALPYEDSAWLRARVYEGHKDAAWATTQAYVKDSWSKLDTAEREILDVVYEQRDNIDKARGLARRKEAEILGIDLGDVAGKAAFSKAEARVRGLEQAISRATADGRDTGEMTKRLNSAKKVLERRQQQYEVNIAKGKTEQEQIAKTEGEILFERRQFSGGATAQTYDAVRDWVEAMVGNESAAKIFNAMDDGYELVRHYRQRMVDTRLISREFGDFLARNYPNYIPIELMDRVSAKGMDDLPHGGQTFGVSSPGIHKLGEKSQTGPRVPPRRSIMDMAFSVEEAAQRNDLMHRAAKWADDPDMANFVRKLDGDEPPPQGFSTISYIDAEKGKQRLAVINELQKGFSLARPELQGLYGIMANAARMPLQAGATTLRPGFIAFNMVNDTIWTLMRFVSEANNPGEVVSALTDFARGYTAQLPEMMGGDPKLIERYRRSGGSIGMESRYEGRPDILLRELHGEGFIPVRTVRTEEGMKQFWKDMWGATTDVAGMAWSRPLGVAGRPTEKAPRLAAFARAERLGKEPIEATQAGRTITADFAAGGDTAKMLNQVVPFLNASTQASAEGAGLISKRPAQFAAVMAGVMSPVVMTEIYNRAVAPEEYKNVSEKTKDTGLVVMYQNPANNGAWEPLFVPLRGFAGAPIPLLRDLIGRSFGDNPRTYQELLQATVGAISPVDPDIGNIATTFIPPPAKLGAELMTNYDLYRGQPIVSRSMEGRLPQHQYGPQTSQTARLLSRSNLPIVGGESPMKIDYAIKGFSPGPGEALLGATDALIRNFGMAQPEHPEKTSGIRDIPLVGGIAGRFFRTVGQQEQTDAYELAEQMTKRNRRVMLDALEASPAWRNATHERRMQLSGVLERQLEAQTKELAGVQTRERDLGLPNKYIGVTTPERENEIDEAVSVYQDWQANPRGRRPTGKQVQLARVYAKRINPRYTAMTRRQRTESEGLGTAVSRQLASSERR